MEPADHLSRGFLFVFPTSAPDGKENKMKVVIRYETETVTFELMDEDARKMGRSVNIDLDELPEEEKQSRLQEACDEQYNRPDYNNSGISTGGIRVILRRCRARMKMKSTLPSRLCRKLRMIASSGGMRSVVK